MLPLLEGVHQVGLRGLVEAEAEAEVEVVQVEADSSKNPDLGHISAMS
jgi:hypothetical protein